MSNISTSPEPIRLPPASGKAKVEPCQIFDVTKLCDERTQTLKRLLEKGHVAVAPLRDPKLILHSHLPHILGSAYALGASSEQLEVTYEHEVTTLVNIDDTFVRGDKISKENWRDFINQKPYTVAYVDFFDEEVKRNNGDWQKVVEEYLYSGPSPLINGLSGGCHPFIHLAYAYEFQSNVVATQALSLVCTELDLAHRLLDHYPPDNSTYKTTSLGDVILHVKADKRFEGLFPVQGITNIGFIFEKSYDALMEHWNAWEVVDPVQQLEQCCDLSVLLAISSGNPTQSFDFYQAHIMTVAHAIRVLWNFFPEERRASILRQYALFTILIYITQFKCSFGIKEIETVQLNGRDWDWVIENALNHKWALDSHFFKVVRAPKVFAETYGEKNSFYLKAAIKFVTEFRGWEGFGVGVEGFLPNRDGYIPE